MCITALSVRSGATDTLLALTLPSMILGSL